MLTWRGDWLDWLMVQVTALFVAVAAVSIGVVIAEQHRDVGPQWHRAATPAEDLAWHIKQRRDLRAVQERDR